MLNGSQLGRSNNRDGKIENLMEIHVEHRLHCGMPLTMRAPRPFAVGRNVTNNSTVAVTAVVPLKGDQQTKDEHNYLNLVGYS